MLDIMRQSTNLIAPMAWEVDFVKSTGLSLDQTRFALSFLFSVAAGMLIRLLRNPTARNLYSGIIGFALLYYPFGSGVYHALVTSAATYMVMMLIPKKCGTWAWLINFPYLIALHVANASGLSWNEGKLDFTGGQMVLTLKLIGMAMSYQDYNSKKPEEMSTYQRSHAFSSLPPILEYLGFVFNCGNLLGGPFVEFKDYQDWIRLQGLWSRAKKPPKLPAFIQGTKRMVQAIIFMGLYMTLTKDWSFAVFETPWYQGIPVWLKLLVMTLVGTVYRCRYYFVWTLGEACFAFGGLDFNGWDEATGKAKWGRCSNAEPVAVEFCDSGRRLAAHWNIGTGRFLRRYVYERLTPVGRKPTFATLLTTQLVSAVWHGVYPGYFMFFAGSAVLFAQSTVIYNWEKAYVPRWLAASWPWWALKVLYTKVGLDFLASAFLILEGHKAVAVWASVHYIPLITMVGVLVLGKLIPVRKERAAGGGEKVVATAAVNAGHDAGAAVANGAVKED